MWDTLKKLIDGGKEEVNLANLKEDPLLLLFALTQTLSFVSIISPWSNTLSPWFSYASKDSKCSIIYKNLKKKFILNQDI